MKKHKKFFFFNDASGQVFKLCASTAAAAAKLLQLCLTLCDAIDGSPPGSSISGILQTKNTGVGCHFHLQCMHAY